VGYREISHGMQAEWSSDQGQFIGAAYEVETGNPIPPPSSTPPPNPPPSTPPPPPTSASGSSTVSSGNLTLVVSSVSSNVTATLSGGSGPYQFLFDCASNGNWDGVVNTPLPTAAFSCAASGGGDVRVWVWDQGGSGILETVVRPTASALGAPGKPTLVVP
jgi:hypothetical protein